MTPGEVATIVVAALAFMTSLVNQLRLRDLHQQLNSRLDELVAAQRKLAHAEGVVEGKADHLQADKGPA